MIEFDPAKITTFSPVNLLPSKLGLIWGISRNEVNIGFKDRTVQIGEQHAKIYLGFLPKKGLTKVGLGLYESRSFWDDQNYDDMILVMRKAKQLYRDYCNFCSSIFGKPAYSCEDQYLLYPKYSWAYAISIWSYEGAFLEVTYDQQDKELPFTVALAWYIPTKNLAITIAKEQQRLVREKMKDVQDKDNINIFTELPRKQLRAGLIRVVDSRIPNRLKMPSYRRGFRIMKRLSKFRNVDQELLQPENQS